VNARDVQTGWLHQESLDGVTAISVECDHVDLAFEADETLSGVIQLIGEPAENLPVIERTGPEITISQRGRYRGRVRPLIRVPAEGCPGTGVKLGKGDIAFQNVQADIAVKLGMGDVEISNGSGATAVSLGKGDVGISGRDGVVAVKLGMGDVSVRRSTGLIAVSTGKGDIAIVDAIADIDVKCGSGDVAVVRPQGGTILINSGNGDVAVQGGEATSVSVRSGKGDIHSSVRLLAHEAELTSTADEDDFDLNGDFDDFDPGDSFSIGDLEFEASDDGVRIGRGNRSILKMGPDGIQIRGSNREISLGPDGIRLGGPKETASDGSEQFTFETGRGDVQVDLPSDLHVRVEVLATGDVQSEVPLVSVARPGPRGTMKRLVGVSDGAGRGPRVNLRVRTKRGDVALRSVRVQSRVQTAPRPEDDAVDRDEQARVILEALARGDLSVNEAERLLEGLDRGH